MGADQVGVAKVCLHLSAVCEYCPILADQIGCSGYANYPHNGEVPDVLEPATMERSLETVAFEFETFGIDLKDLLFNQNKSFVYSEQGLGGATAFGKIAPNITFVAQHPFWGEYS